MEINRDLIFLIIMIAMASFAYTEAVLEGDEGWAKDKKVWRFKIGWGYDYTSYHIVAYYVLFPILIIVLPLAIAGFSWSFFWFLLSSYLLGTIIEDFLWFVFNPKRPLRMWNPKETKWYPWVKYGKVALPVSYVVKFILAIIILVYLS